VLVEHLGAAPYQSSRPDLVGRGHYLFAQPPGRMIGNGGGRLGSAWGQISRNFAIELGYFNSGGLETDLSPNTPANQCQVQDFCDTELSLSGFSLSAVGYLPIGGDDSTIDLFGKIGGYDFDIDITQTISNSSVPGSLGHSTGFTVGAGAIFSLGDNFGIRTGVDYFDIENADLWSLSMGLEYHF
jgi:opacity protein-like surface antigen